MNNTLHLKAPGDWINDPNGFIYYKGKYHLFYQYFPCSDRWGTMHWGHAVSEDLIHWHHLGISIFPTKSYDRNGCFSGSAICLPNGNMALYYTGVRYIDEDEENINLCLHGSSRQCQVMIESEDGFTFDNYGGKRMILPAFTDETVGNPAEFRDPKVFYEEDRYYMVTGSTCEYREGVLLVYESPDAREWKLKFRMADRRLGTILECPDLMKIGDEWVLVCSAMDIVDGNVQDVRPHQSIIQKVHFDAQSGEVTLGDGYRYLDYGMDLYAPQSNTDKNGNRTFFGWIRMPHGVAAHSNSASNGRAWNGMMCLPRVIDLVDFDIYTRVHPEVIRYFEQFEEEVIQLRNASDEDQHAIKAIKQVATEEGACRNSEKCVRIRTELSEGEKISINGYLIALEEGKVCTDRTALIDEGIDSTVNRISTTPYVGNRCELDIYIEPNLVEVYINDGLYVISNFIEAAIETTI